MKKLFNTSFQDKRGITIYIAVTITAALILVSFSIINITLKQISLSSAGRDSQAAFYAADSGIECALYWNFRNEIGPYSAFDPSKPVQDINCNNTLISVSRTMGTSTFRMTFPEPYCAIVTVGKVLASTTIESRGYNTCSSAGVRRVERAILVNI
jgi:Tfp pilus assembly protein PilX